MPQKTVTLGYWLTGFLACVFFAWGMWAFDVGVLGMAMLWGGIAWFVLSTKKELEQEEVYKEKKKE